MIWWCIQWIKLRKMIEPTTENRKIPSKLTRTKSLSAIFQFILSHIWSAVSHSWLDPITTKWKIFAFYISRMFTVILENCQFHQSNSISNGAFNCKMISCNMYIAYYMTWMKFWIVNIFWFSSLQRKFIEFEMEWFQC